MLGPLKGASLGLDAANVCARPIAGAALRRYYERGRVRLPFEAMDVWCEFD
jgi:hypothetical protein